MLMKQEAHTVYRWEDVTRNKEGLPICPVCADGVHIHHKMETATERDCKLMARMENGKWWQCNCWHQDEKANDMKKEG